MKLRLYCLCCWMTLLCLAMPARAEGEEFREAALAGNYLEVVLPEDWRRTLAIMPPEGWTDTLLAQKNVFKGSYFYERDDHAVSILVVPLNRKDRNCRQLLEERKTSEPLYKLGRTLYSPGEEAVLICTPTRDGKSEAIFAVMAKDAIRRHEARAMLAAFKKIEIPSEDCVPGPDVRAYAPSSLVPECAQKRWGGVEYNYKSRGGEESLVLLMPFFPHWATLEDCLRNLAVYLGPLTPRGNIWETDEKVSGWQKQVALSRDKKVLLMLKSPSEAVTRELRAAFDKFDW